MDSLVGVDWAVHLTKRTVIVLTETPLADHVASLQNRLRNTRGMEGTYRLPPVQTGLVDGV